MSKEIDDVVSEILQSSNVKKCREEIRKIEKELMQSFPAEKLNLFLEYERLINEELYEIILALIQMKEVDLE